MIARKITDNKMYRENLFFGTFHHTEKSVRACITIFYYIVVNTDHFDLLRASTTKEVRD